MNNSNIDNTENPIDNTDHIDTTEDDGASLREEKILELSDRMLEKISYAIDELSLCQSKEKERVKEVEYDEENKKVLRETHIEKERCEISESLIDTAALKQLVSTLKDIKDIHTGLCSSKDEDDEESGVIVISPIDAVASFDEESDEE